MSPLYCLKHASLYFFSFNNRSADGKFEEVERTEGRCQENNPIILNGQL